MGFLVLLVLTEIAIPLNPFTLIEEVTKRFPSLTGSEIMTSVAQLEELGILDPSGREIRLIGKQ